jgi:hypothetical protein
MHLSSTHWSLQQSRSCNKTLAASNLQTRNEFLIHQSKKWSIFSHILIYAGARKGTVMSHPCAWWPCKTVIMGATDHKKMVIFWVVAPCSLVEVYWCFRAACCFHNQGDEYSVNFYQTTQHYNPEGGHLHACCPENVESYYIIYIYKAGTVELRIILCQSRDWVRGLSVYSESCAGEPLIATLEECAVTNWDKRSHSSQVITREQLYPACSPAFIIKTVICRINPSFILKNPQSIHRFHYNNEFRTSSFTLPADIARFLSTLMIFQILTTASMKMTVFWDVALCSLVEAHWRFRGSHAQSWVESQSIFIKLIALKA